MGLRGAPLACPTRRGLCPFAAHIERTHSLLFFTKIMFLRVTLNDLEFLDWENKRPSIGMLESRLALTDLMASTKRKLFCEILPSGQYSTA